MTNSNKIIVLLVILILGVAYLGFTRFMPQGTVTTNSITPDNNEIEQIVAAYIKNNPKDIIDSLTSYQQQEYVNQTAKSEKYVQDNWKEIISNKADPVVGNPNAKVTIVEFFDYMCGYCKRVMPHVIKVLAENPNIRVVFKEYPILTANSDLASKAALSVYQLYPDQYLKFHQALLTHPISGLPSILQMAVDLGLDKAKIEEKMQDKTIEEALNNNRRLALDGGINGTPAFVINGKFIPGAVDYDTLKALIAEAEKAS